MSICVPVPHCIRSHLVQYGSGQQLLVLLRIEFGGARLRPAGHAAVVEHLGQLEHLLDDLFDQSLEVVVRFVRRRLGASNGGGVGMPLGLWKACECMVIMLAISSAIGYSQKITIQMIHTNTIPQ